MKYFFHPQHHRPEELLEKCGFRPSNTRGWVMNRLDKVPLRMHALTSYDGSIDLHEDWTVKDKHVTHRSGRCLRFIEILKTLDEGKIPVVGKKMLKHWPFKFKEELNIISDPWERLKASIDISRNRIKN